MTSRSFARKIASSLIGTFEAAEGDTSLDKEKSGAYHLTRFLR
jgi:hypothetical protein